jgi:hypothetical protein
VDGIVRFDRQKDDDDVRIYVDPKQDIDAASFSDETDRDRCMEGVLNFEDVFSLNEQD